MLYARRKRLIEVAEREAAGESFWTDDLSDATRARLLYAVKDLAEGTTYTHYSFDLIEYARDRVLRDEGLVNLAGKSDPELDMGICIAECDVDLVWSVLEAVHFVAAIAASKPLSGVVNDTRETLRTRLPHFVATIKTVLRESRVSHDLIDGRFVPLESLELHEEVVVPAITLLGSNPDYEAVEKAYRTALEEIHGGKPDDAITDAGTALQEALKLLGCEGNRLGPLIKSARKRGLFASHDSPLVDGTLSAMEWVSADRSTKGDAHNTQEATREDAWLTVHVVGALILRLLRGSPRAVD